ncbi:MAG: FkbM family methyltransferase [Solirubrobacteraceae bacterium MAG38_C4-C5]|nr:FkbM family methyltransferase [Candidatus Siliceabacter maunaloa]
MPTLIEEQTRLIREGLFAEALAAHEAGLGADPEDPAALHHRAWLLAALKRFDDAADAARRALALGGEPHYARRLAACLRSGGDPEGAASAEAEAEEIEARRREGFAFEQTELKARLSQRIGELIALVTTRTPYFGDEGSARDARLDHAEMLFGAHPVDSIVGWADAVPEPRPAGSIATVAGVGRFHITNPLHVLQKRLARGVAWELPIAALLAELAVRCSSDTLIVDVGANIGAHAICAASHHRGRLIALEPTPDTYGHLLQNIALNDVPNLDPRNVACSSAPGAGRMEDLDPLNPAAATLRLDPEGPIPITTLDEITSGDDRPVALLKMDVEGHEASVLAGASQTLAHGPVVICELPGLGPQPAREVLESLGYEGQHFFRSDWIFLPPGT